jgi:hypothetical protein
MAIFSADPNYLISPVTMEVNHFVGADGGAWWYHVMQGVRQKRRIRCPTVAI